MFRRRFVAAAKTPGVLGCPPQRAIGGQLVAVGAADLALGRGRRAIVGVRSDPKTGRSGRSHNVLRS
jgi:hypothetical protein